MNCLCSFPLDQEKEIILASECIEQQIVWLTMWHWAALELR